MRWARLGCAVAAVALVAAWLLPGRAPASPSAAPSSRVTSGGGVVAGAGDPRVGPALAVLHRWDARRARAWGRGDEVGLRALYEHGSLAGARDVRLLRAYAARRLAVRRLRTQVFAVRVLRAGADRLVLRVHDRVAGGVLEGGGTSRPLPPGAPAVRVVELRRSGPGWLVAGVRAVSGSG